MPTLEQAIEYITQGATESDIERIYAAAKERSRALRNVRAAAVRVGAEVQISGIRPKYYVGMSGTVKTVEQKRTRAIVSVLLDARSTEELRLHTFVPNEVERFEVHGIPAMCCAVQ